MFSTYIGLQANLTIPKINFRWSEIFKYQSMFIKPWILDNENYKKSILSFKIKSKFFWHWNTVKLQFFINEFLRIRALWACAPLSSGLIKTTICSHSQIHNNSEKKKTDLRFLYNFTMYIL